MRGIDPTSARPVYLQIVDSVLAAIDSGEYNPGDTLPTNENMMAKFGVASGTLRRALDLLRTRDVIVGVQGRGTFVANTYRRPTHTNRTSNYTETSA